MRFIEEHNEVLPTFAPGVQKVWEDCGTYITSNEHLVAEKELEHFVQCLVQSITDDLKLKMDEIIKGVLNNLGYLK